MLKFLFKRLLVIIPTLWAVITVCYFMLQITPGGPFDGERKVSPAVLANLQAKYHLDKPLHEQYLYYWNNLLHGDLGASFFYSERSVNDLLANALPVSLTIGGTAMILALIFGLLIGTFAALKQNSPIDYCLMLLGNLGHVIPSFVVGPLLILIFALGLKLLPAGGWDNFSIQYMILPITLLTIINVATIGRIMRGSLIEVLNSNFIRTAKAKGLSQSRIILKHAFKPALMPVVSVMGPLCISTITSAIVTESVFSLPGIGKLITNAASNRDYTLMLGIVVLITVFATVINLIVDMLYAYLDPKIRYQ
jgi:oligopeptide transport system permease protein